MKLGLIIAAFVALSVAALTGWTRHVSATPAAAVVPASVAQPVNTQPVTSAAGQPCVEPGVASQAYPQAGSTAQGTTPPVYAVTPFGASTGYAARSGESVTTYESSQYPAPYPAPQYETQYAPPPPAVERERVVYEYAPVRTGTRVVYYRRVKHHRPFSHSVAIVAGSAGAGAAIGALAGGGRGAGIGALAGGAGGLVYDRLTH